MKNKRVTILAAALASFTYVGATPAEAETIPERLIEDLQEDFGFEDFQAAGVAGNLAKETGNFRYLQELNPIVEGSRGGVGYAQWTASRRVAFEDWAASMGFEDLTEYEANYGFLIHEMTGSHRRVVDKVLATSSAAEATEVFMDEFLKPHHLYSKLDERIAYADQYLTGEFSGAGCQRVHRIYGDDDMIVVAMCPEPERVPDFHMASAGSAGTGEYLHSDVEAVLADLVGYGPLEHGSLVDPITAARQLGAEGPLDDQIASVLVELASNGPLVQPHDPFMTAEVSYGNDTMRYDARVSSALMAPDDGPDDP